MAYNTEVANLALGHIGVNKEIDDIETEQSREAKAVRRYWDICLEQVLRDHPFGFATKVASLNLVEEDPNTDWLFSYRYPSDCLFVRKLLSGVNITTPNDPIDYKLSKDDTARLIMTNQEDAVVEYTVKITDWNQVPSDFKMAFSFRLGIYICPSLSAGDPFKIKADLQQMYLLEISKAEANSINEESNDPDVESEFVRSRI